MTILYSDNTWIGATPLLSIFKGQTLFNLARIKEAIMQSKAKPFDDISNLFTNAVGAVKGVGDEVKAMGRARAEGLIADMDLVGRDEFEAFKKVIEAQRNEIDALKAQLAKLSPAKKATRTAKKPSTSKAASKTSVKAKKKPTVKKTAAKKPAVKKKAAKASTAKKR